jgi:hypothetical protein
MSILGTAAVVEDMSILGTAAVVEDLSILGTTAVVEDLSILGTADTVTDMSILGTAAVVEDMSILATSDIVTDMSILATSDIVTDMSILATAAIVEDMSILGTSANVTAMATVSTNIADVSSFADQYTIASSAPGSPDEGDLWYDSTNNVLKVHNGSSFVAVTSATAGITDVADDSTPQLGGDLDANGNQIQWSKGADVASATALPVLTDGNYSDVTGTTTVTSINTTGGAGTLIKLHFDSVLTLTHHATDLILPGGANITTAVGDEAEFIEYASGDYRCTNYSRASGYAIINKTATGGGTDEVFQENDQTVTTNYELTANTNAMSIGPITINAGVEVTVPAGGAWVVQQF